MTPQEAIEAELAQWPGVQVHYGHRAKHLQATFAFEGRTRFIVFPGSGSDSQRGALNTVRDMRRELTTLGAKRRERVEYGGRRGGGKTHRQRTRIWFDEARHITPQQIEALRAWRAKPDWKETLAEFRARMPRAFHPRAWRWLSTASPIAIALTTG